ncbi:MAG: DUF4270 family protein [Chitinophagaceae bacterium]
MQKQKSAATILSALNGSLWLFCITACTRSTIEFGTVPENNYTNLSYTDTVAAQLSTVLEDSFATGNATSFLTGRYTDPYLGTVTAKAFFQLDRPATLPEIPAASAYDSLTLVIKPSEYYYGDTSQAQTIIVSELAQAIVTGYNDQLYNTSGVAVKPVPLGTKTLRIRPAGDDSVVIRLADSKGAELFTKLQQADADVSSTESFLHYFKGLALAGGPLDAAMFGWLGGAGSVVIRLHYHTTTPYETSHIADFPSLSNELAFNQVLADRPGTGIVSGGSTSGLTEIPAAQTGNRAYAQPGTGLRLKVTFPSLKDILFTNNYVRLIRADLIVRPLYLSYDRNLYKLPDGLYLAATNGSNIVGNAISDSTGAAVLYATPVIDAVYGENTYYRFNVTAYINQLLQLSGSDNGLYIMPDFSATSPGVTRLVLGTGHADYITRLQLSVLTINK